MGKALPGNSVRKRIREVNEIYDRYVRDGLSNREIWRRYVWPAYGISERSFRNTIIAQSQHKSDGFTLENLRKFRQFPYICN